MANLDLAGIITRVCTDLKEKFSKVAVERSLTSGTKSATVTVDGVKYDLYAPTPPTASTIAPLMDGTASYGSGNFYARSNHVHPTDTSRQATLVSGTNIKTINGDSILGSGDLTVGGGGGYDYRIDVTISGSTVTADFNGASLTEIATAVTDDPATNVVIVVVVGSYTTRGIITYSSYNTAWGDVASNIEFVSFFYDNGDNKYYIRRTSLTGSGYSTTESRCA